MTPSDKSDTDRMIGRATVIVVALIIIGGTYAWGPITLVITGSALLVRLIFIEMISP